MVYTDIVEFSPPSLPLFWASNTPWNLHSIHFRQIATLFFLSKYQKNAEQILCSVPRSAYLFSILFPASFSSNIFDQHNCSAYLISIVFPVYLISILFPAYLLSKSSRVRPHLIYFPSLFSHYVCSVYLLSIFAQHICSA